MSIIGIPMNQIIAVMVVRLSHTLEFGLQASVILHTIGMIIIIMPTLIKSPTY